jgi:hypothetical protein
VTGAWECVVEVGQRWSTRLSVGEYTIHSVTGRGMDARVEMQRAGEPARLTAWASAMCGSDVWTRHPDPGQASLERTQRGAFYRGERGDR